MAVLLYVKFESVLYAELLLLYVPKMPCSLSRTIPATSTASAVLLLLLVLGSLLQPSPAQFFTKTSKSVPRLGRRGDPAFDALRAMVSEETTPLRSFFNKYDANGDWCLTPDELWQVPVFRMAESSRGVGASPPASSDSVSNVINGRNDENKREDSIRGLLSTLTKK